MRKFVIYTAIFGEPGRFNFPEVSIRHVDKICFTDFNIEGGCHQMIPVRKGRYKKNDFYDVRTVNFSHLSPVMAQRFMKICIPREIFDNYEYSAYVDCKRPIGIDFEWCKKLLKRDGSDFLTLKHQKRDCIYDEAKKCIDKKKGNKHDITRQVNFYNREKYPEHNGLYCTFWLFRRHTERLKEFSNLWWGQLKQYSYRDQISLPYVANKYDMKITTYKRPQ